MEIIKGQPIPKPRRGRSEKYPFSKLSIGDQFNAGEYSRALHASINGLCRSRSKEGKVFRCCMVENGQDKLLRVWRES